MPKVFRISPDLSDGEHWTILDNKKILLQSIENWLDEFEDYEGEGFEIQVVEMTKEEIDKLPEI